MIEGAEDKKQLIRELTQLMQESKKVKKNLSLLKILALINLS